MTNEFPEGFNQLPPRILLWGGTGQAKVIRPIVEHWGSEIVAVIDDTPDLPPPFPDVPLVHGSEFDQWASNHDVEDMGFIITIGNPHGRVRLQLHDRLQAAGFKPVKIAHPTAWIDANVQAGDGCQVMAGAFVGTGANLGRECIINTKASIDHECSIGDGVEVAPGATLCGLVQVETNAWICAGATVLPRRRIGPDAIVGAGAVVTRDVRSAVTVVGVPAKETIGRQR